MNRAEPGSPGSLKAVDSPGLPGLLPLGLLHAALCLAWFCEVAFACSHAQLAAAGIGFNMDGTVAPELRGLGGVVVHGVLIADVVCHLSSDVVHFVERTGEIGDAAGFFCE